MSKRGCNIGAMSTVKKMFFKICFSFESDFILKLQDNDKAVKSKM